jgi:hypothetical protein
MCVGGLILAGIYCLFGGPVFERSEGPSEDASVPLESEKKSNYKWGEREGPGRESG